jgi:hypothetical protein
MGHDHSLQRETDFRYAAIAGAAVIEIVATLLTVKLLVPMSGMEQRDMRLGPINYANAGSRISSSTRTISVTLSGRNNASGPCWLMSLNGDFVKLRPSRRFRSGTARRGQWTPTGWPWRSCR